MSRQLQFVDCRQPNSGCIACQLQQQGRFPSFPRVEIYHWILIKVYDPTCEGLISSEVAEELNFSHIQILQAIVEILLVYPDLFKVTEVDVAEPFQLTEMGTLLLRENLSEKLREEVFYKTFRETYPGNFVVFAIGKDWIDLALNSASELVVVPGRNMEECRAYFETLKKIKAAKDRNYDDDVALVMEHGLLKVGDMNKALMLQKGSSFPKERILVSKVWLSMIKWYVEFASTLQPKKEMETAV